MRWLNNDGKPIDIEPYLGALVAELRALPGIVAAYLYGSYGTPLQTPLSDVDLALVFRPEAVPSFKEELRLIGLVTGTLHEDDVSVTILNRSPCTFQYRVLATGRRLLSTDPIALADFVEGVLRRHGDYVIDERRFLAEYDEALLEAYG